jgi:hypothetical protein
MGREPLGRRAFDGEGRTPFAIPVALVEDPILASAPEAPVRSPPIPRGVADRAASADPSDGHPLSKLLVLPDPDDVRDIDRTADVRLSTPIDASSGGRTGLVSARPERYAAQTQLDPEEPASRPIPPAIIVLALSLATMLGGFMGPPVAGRRRDRERAA